MRPEFAQLGFARFSPRQEPPPVSDQAAAPPEKPDFTIPWIGNGFGFFGASAPTQVVQFVAKEKPAAAAPEAPKPDAPTGEAPKS